MNIPLPALEDTRALAQSICQAASQPLTIALVGSLGTGKTQFVRYFAQPLGVAPEEVTSPTYVLLQRYSAKPAIYHFDFYRLTSAGEVWELGIDELYERPVWVIIEWADKFTECLPADYLQIELTQDETGLRSATITATGPASSDLLMRLNA